MRRKAFWGQSGRMTRQVEGLVNDVLLDCCVGTLGIGLIERATGKHLRWLPWAELHRLAQQGPLEQLGAAVAERSEPPCLDKIIRFGDRKFVRTGQHGSIAEGQWFIAEHCINGQSKQIIPLTPIYAVSAWDGPRELLREITEAK